MLDDGRKRDPLSQEDFQLMRWPGETYYWAMNAEKIDRVIEEHIRRDEVATDLIGDPAKEDDFRPKE